MFMRLRSCAVAMCVFFSLIGAIYALQKPFREYNDIAIEYSGFPVPADWGVKSEWTFGRLIYPAVVDYARWTMDYPRSDRHFSVALRRLTRVSARPVEQGVDLDDGEAICHNMDLGYAWERADNPLYPEKFFALGFRIGVNYVIYDMTH